MTRIIHLISFDCWANGDGKKLIIVPIQVHSLPIFKVNNSSVLCSALKIPICTILWFDTTEFAHGKGYSLHLIKTLALWFIVPCRAGRGENCLIFETRADGKCRIFASVIYFPSRAFIRLRSALNNFRTGTKCSHPTPCAPVLLICFIWKA